MIGAEFFGIGLQTSEIAMTQSDITGEYRTITVGPYQLAPGLRLLTRNGQKINIGQKPFDILVALVEANGELLSKSDLLEIIWPNQIVEENSLQAHMSALRRILGPDRNLISTDFGRGYRFTGASSQEKATNQPRFPSLPMAFSPMIGRSAEVKELTVFLKESRLVTITGTGGIGKSRMALEIASLLQNDFPGGICMIELSLIADPEIVASSIINSLHLDLPNAAFAKSGQNDAPPVLLILDNCEHALEEVCGALQTISPFMEIKFLTTSQEPLGLPGEQIYRLQPLASPPANAELLVDILKFPAAELLAARIRESDGNFQISETDAPLISQICRQLDGIPLAIELAAARVPLLGLPTIVADLGDRFRLLTAGRRAGLPRHRTLQATLDWSFSLLNPKEKDFLTKLSIFAGSFSLPSAAFIAAVYDEIDVRTLVAGLASKSLIVVEQQGNTTRFRLLESLRAFLLEKIASTGSLPQLADRHAKLFQMRLAQAANDWKSVASEVWLRQYGDDINDVRAALDWTFVESKDPEPAANLLCASLPFWMQLSRLEECGKRVDFALDRLTQTNQLSKPLEMQLCAALGASTAWVDGPTPKAEKAWNRTLALAERSDDKEHRLQAHYGLWLYHLRCGNYGQSLTNANALLESARRHRDESAQFAALRTVGVSKHFLGDHSGAGNLIDPLLDHPEPRDHSFSFRFGVDQRVAALAFRSRVLWVEGKESAAFEMADNAVREAINLDHISSVCCAYLEGACTVAALAKNAPMLGEYAGDAWAVANQNNLGFWRAYAGAFLALASTWKKRDVFSIDSLENAVLALSSANLHPSYSVFSLAVASLLRTEQPDKARRVLRTVDFGVSHWALPEVLRLEASFLDKVGRRKQLTKALRLADSNKAIAWSALIKSDQAVDVMKEDNEASR
ncbi:MAG: hypothetical protein EKK40_18970 [Bradyrhizobiaceae bacterium]|nr:MAG: hypothetical protein EKK40_18970 [Bradyrhizobiaceae bacterium]